MTALQEYLYQYIADKQYPDLQNNPEYISAQRMRDEAEKALSDGLTKEQQRLFSRYMDEENHLVSLQLRHFFLETLRMAHSIFNFLQ